MHIYAETGADVFYSLMNGFVSLLDGTVLLLKRFFGGNGTVRFMKRFLFLFWMKSTRSEVYAYAECEATVVRRVELVVADVCKTNVVGQVGIEQVVSHAAAKPQTAVETFEAVA